jgi:hypothetical protein
MASKILNEYASHWEDTCLSDIGVRQSLTVGDAERLAKAGVQIDLNKVDITNPPQELEVDQWAKAVMTRLRMNPKFSFAMNTGEMRVRMMGAPSGDKVFIFLVMGTHEPVLLEDSVFLFPSDALMGKIHMLGKQA